MTSLLYQLIDDDAGFVVSSELVLVATVAVLAMVVGLSEVALNVSEELEDTGSSIGSIAQSYFVNGLTGHMGITGGSFFTDLVDFCDRTGDIGTNVDRAGEGSTLR